MTTSASERGWGPGWPTNNSSKMVTLVRSDGLRLPIRKEIAELVSLLIDFTELLGYNIIPGWTWGFSNRPISGTNIPSNHSWGLAIDINAPVNPQSYTFHSNIPEKISNLWKAYGFRWGGDYRYPTKYDPMHFEYMGTPDTVAVHLNALKAFISNNNGTVPNPPVAKTYNTKSKDGIMDIIFCPENGRYYADRPDGLIRLTKDDYWNLAAGNYNPHVVKTAALLTKLHSGPRIISYNDAPVMET